MAAVDHHRKRVPQSQRYYEKKRAEGKKHNQAIRALGRHLCRVIFKMLSQERPLQDRALTKSLKLAHFPSSKFQRDVHGKAYMTKAPNVRVVGKRSWRPGGRLVPCRCYGAVRTAVIHFGFSPSIGHSRI